MITHLDTDGPGRTDGGGGLRFTRVLSKSSGGGGIRRSPINSNSVMRSSTEDGVLEYTTPEDADIEASGGTPGMDFSGSGAA